MSDDLLRNPTHNGHLLVGALKRHKNRPVLFLGDTTLTGGQLAERVSQYIQAFEALGAGTGVTVGLLSLNRPEVLMIRAKPNPGLSAHRAAPARVAGRPRLRALRCRGQRADHRPQPDVRRARAGTAGESGLAQEDPDDRSGAGCLEDVAVDVSAEAAKYQPKPLTVADLPPDHIGGLTYTGGTTGKPKGVIGTSGNIASMTQIQLSEWEWPEHPRFLMCTPLSHAGAAFFTPTVVKGGEMVVLAKFDPAEVRNND